MYHHKWISMLLLLLSHLFTTAIADVEAIEDVLAGATCSADIYPINIYSSILPNTSVFPIGLVGQYQQNSSEAAGLIRFAVDYINWNTSILPNVSLVLYEADTGSGSMVAQSTTIASVATIAIEGVRALVGGNSLETMTNCAQASSDLKAPHVGGLVQDNTLGTKSTYPYMLRAIPPYKEQGTVLFRVMKNLGWEKATIVATTDSYGNDAGVYTVANSDMKNAGFKFTQQTVSATRSDFPTKAKNMVTAAQTVRVTCMFTQPQTGFPFIDYLYRNATQSLVGTGYSYILSQPMCKPLLTKDPAYKQYWPLIDGSICIYPRGGDLESALYNDFYNAWQTANETLYPGSRDPESFNWYGVDSVFSQAHAISSLVNSGTQVDKISGTAFLNALKNVSFTGVTGRFAFDSSYDRRGIWDVYNNIYDSATDTLTTKHVANYRWYLDSLEMLDQFMFFGGNLTVPPANVTAPTAPPTPKPSPTPAPTAPPRLPTLRPYDTTLSGGLGALVGLSSIITLFAAIVLALNWHSYSTHGPFYCGLIILGTLCAMGAALVMLPRPTNSLCMAFPWLLGIGFSFVYGCLFIKTWVLYGVFRKAAQLQKTSLTPFYIAKLIAFFVGIEVILLIIWNVVDPQTVRRKDYSDHTYGFECKSDTDTFWIIFLCYKGAWLIFGSVLAFLTRNIASEYNESKSIAYAIYADIALMIIGVPLAIATDDVGSSVIVIKVVVVCIAFVFTLVSLFWGIWKNIFFSSMYVDDPQPEPHYSQSSAVSHDESRAGRSSSAAVYLA